MSPQGVVTWSNATTGITTGLVQRATTLLGQSNWVDYVAFSVTGSVTQLRVVDPNSPASMAYIPAGIFTMGDTIGDGYVFAKPTHKCEFQVREITIAGPVGSRIRFRYLCRRSVGLASAMRNKGFDMVGQTVERVTLPQQEVSSRVKDFCYSRQGRYCQN